MTDLFPYQREGAAFLAGRTRALLADEMGLGKSAQAIAACDAVGAQTVMVVCPASVVANWRREFERFSKSSKVLLTGSYDKVTRMKPESFGDIDVLILDEAHYLKTRTAKRTKAIFGEKCDGKGGLVERAKHVFALTGTPTPNNPSELWPMLRALAPEVIEHPVSGKPYAYWTFVQRFCVTRDNGFGIQIVKGKNLPQLKAAIAPFVLRRKKEQVLKDLPPIRFDTLPVEGRITWDDDLRASERALAKILDEKGVAGLKEAAPHVASLRRATGLAKVEACVDWIADWFEGGGGKLVVFAHHRDVLDALCDHLRDRQGLGVAYVTGGTEQWARQIAVDAFQKEPSYKVFLGQIQAAGTGLTLTASSDVLFVESSWVPAENEQAAMRVHRIGQKNACLIRFATLAKSLDEQIQKAVMRKTADISKLFG